MNNASYKTSDVKKVCEKKLKINFRSGKEFNGHVIHNDSSLARITVPKGKKSIPPKTYKSMGKQLGLTIKEFDSFLACPFTADMVIKKLKE